MQLAAGAVNPSARNLKKTNWLSDLRGLRQPSDSRQFLREGPNHCLSENFGSAAWLARSVERLWSRPTRRSPADPQFRISGPFPVPTKFLLQLLWQQASCRPVSSNARILCASLLKET